MIGMEETLSVKNSQINNMYDRRADLVPQITAVVKKYMEYEKWTLEWIVKLREWSWSLEALNAMVSKWDIKSWDFSQLLASTLSQIKITMEAYPELKADTQFTNLFTELEWSENRIRFAIMDYNKLVWDYNIKLRSFPGNIISWYFNFKIKEMVNPPEWKDIKTPPNVDELLDTSK